MSYPVLARRDTALDDAETVALLRDRLGDVVVSDTAEFGELTVEVTSVGWHAAVAACRDEDLLSFDLFDCLFGVDAGEDGFDVVAVLYSTSRGRRIMLRARCDGGREEPVLDSVADLYPGANWMERETFDMFGIDFPGHPGLLPRILCVENFEGWPLRKEFPLASRVAKPWPGVKDPAEPDEHGNVVVREPAIGEAAGPSGLDEVIAKQAREANADPDADEASDGDDTAPADEPQREEVELDQETYDRLIADGKSERIARSKAKAAFIKKQRAAERAAADDTVDSTADQAPDETPAPPAPDADPGDGTEGRTAEQAAPPEGSGDEDAAATASAAAEATRADQVAAREARAAEEAEQAARVDDEVEPIPAGTPPPDPDDPDDAAADASADAADDADDGDDAEEEEEQEEPGEEQEDEGPYGPGSALPRGDGSGPDGHSVKATTDGNVFVTQDSEQWVATRADVWFVDEDAARAAGFQHWDPYLRTDLDAPAGTSASERADALDTGPAPVGGSLDVPDPRTTTTVAIDASDGPDVPGYGALDTHERTPGGVPADQPGPDDAGADAPDADAGASAADASDGDHEEQDA